MHYVSITSLVVAYIALTRFYVIARSRLSPLHIVMPFILVKALVLLLTVEGTVTSLGAAAAVSNGSPDEGDSVRL